MDNWTQIEKLRNFDKSKTNNSSCAVELKPSVMSETIIVKRQAHMAIQIFWFESQTNWKCAEYISILSGIM